VPIRTISQVFPANFTWVAPWNLAFAPAVYVTGESANGGTSSHGVRSGPGSGGGAVGGEPVLAGVAPGTVLTGTIPQGNTGLQTTVTGGAVTVAANPGLAPVTTTGGLGGTAGANTVAFAGGNGSNALSGASVSGGGGGGSAGASGAGGSTATAAGGAAGAGQIGPPSLAGATGATGGTALNPGNNGIAPGSGASGGGSGGTLNHTGGNGAPGQAVIIWAVFDLPTLARGAMLAERGRLATILAPFPAAAPPSSPTAPTIRPARLAPPRGARGRLAVVLAPFPAPAPPSTPTAPVVGRYRPPPRAARRGRLATIVKIFPGNAPPPVIPGPPAIPPDILKPWRKHPWPRRSAMPHPAEALGVLAQASGTLIPPGVSDASAQAPGPASGAGPGLRGQAAEAVADLARAATARAVKKTQTGRALQDQQVAESVFYWQMRRNKGSK
jgi:hypothetical protein